MRGGRVLVLGAAGRLGTRLCAVLGDRAAGLGHAELDITDAASIERAMKEILPATIVNCAAFTDVDAAETQRDRAHAVNAEGPGNLARAATEAGAFLVHVSTDYVFDGAAARPYAETDEPNPIQVYGTTKLEGERAVLKGAPGAAIVRTSWLYGPGEGGFVQAILKAARSTRAPLRVVADQTGSPTYVGDLAAAIVALIDRPAAGVFHTAASGACSRHDMARVIVEAAGLDPNIVEPCATEDLPPRPAARPPFSALACPAWEAAGFAPLPEWMPALTAALREWRP